MKNLAIVFFFFQMQLCFGQNGNEPGSAIAIQHQNGWTGAFDMVGTTYIGNEPSCTASSSSPNRWFKFTATTNLIRIIGSFNLSNASIALWNVEGGSWTELSCARGWGHPYTLSITSDDLIAGQVYYLSVSSLNNGTFDLLVETTYDNNYVEGATEIFHQDGWTSGVYNNYFTTPEGSEPSCIAHPGSPNMWFVFTATSQLVRVTGNFNFSHASMALWKEDGGVWTELHCSRGYGAPYSIPITSDELIAGETYYISVNSAYAGTFDFLVQNTYDNNYVEGASEMEHVAGWSSGILNNRFSTSEGNQPACVAHPGSPDRWFKFTALSDVVRITGNFNFVHASMALWKEVDGVWTELDCDRGYSNPYVLSVQFDELEEGEIYFLSVNSAYVGTYELEIVEGGQEYWNYSSNVLSPTNDVWMVGIGTTTVPDGYKMAIKGKAIMEEVKVQLSGNWPDFVFEKDYKLLTLEEMENYILINKHLPEIPSEVEVTENGIYLGEMNAKLLQKIEELTLYMIDMNKQMKSQNERVEQLETQNAELKDKIQLLENQ